MFRDLFKAGSVTKLLIGSSISAGFVFTIGVSQSVQVNSKSTIAIEPLVCDVVSAIAPPSIPVTCLIDRKQDVHDIKLTPRQVQVLRSGNQVFTLGSEMTPAIKKWLDNPLTVVVGVSAIEIENQDEDRDDHDEGDLFHHDHDHGGIDPHIWHDPKNVIKMGNIISKNIDKKISFFDGETKKVLKERTQSVNSILEDLDQWTQKQIATIPSDQRTIVSKHKAMEYYGDAFGLKVMSLLDALGDSSSLKPQTIAAVTAELKEDNVQALFAEQRPPSKLLKNLSRQTSTPIAPNQIYVDSLMPTGNTISVAVHNTCTIVNSLGGECDKKEGDKLENRWDSLIKS